MSKDLIVQPPYANKIHLNICTIHKTLKSAMLSKPRPPAKQSGFDSQPIQAKLTEFGSQFGNHGVSSESE